MLFHLCAGVAVVTCLVSLVVHISFSVALRLLGGGTKGSGSDIKLPCKLTSYVRGRRARTDINCFPVENKAL